MGNKSRIPTTISAFFTYISISDDYLQVTPPGATDPNWKRLGLTNANATDWHDKRKYWSDTLYPTYSNVNTRTKTVNENVKKFMKDFRTFGNPLINIIAASPNATQDDANTFNFVLERKKPSHHHEPITDNCDVSADIIGSAIQFRFKVGHDTKRASLAKGADSVQLLYKLGDPAPTGTNDPGLLSMMISRASYKHVANSNDSGKKLYLYARWYNIKYPDLAGGWCKLFTVVMP